MTAYIMASANGVTFSLPRSSTTSSGTLRHRATACRSLPGPEYVALTSARMPVIVANSPRMEPASAMSAAHAWVVLPVPFGPLSIRLSAEPAATSAAQRLTGSQASAMRASRYRAGIPACRIRRSAA